MNGRHLARLVALSVTAIAVFPASAADRRVTIINATGATMTAFYASNSGRDEWEEDILGVDVLSSGESVRVDIDDGTGRCMFDFKAVFADGDTLERRGINVCEISEYRYTAD